MPRMLALDDAARARLTIAATAIAPAEREAWLMRCRERATTTANIGPAAHGYEPTREQAMAGVCEELARE
jgi:hypothetical protein